MERAECSGQDELYLRELVVGHWHDPDRRPNLCKLADVPFDRHNDPDCTGTRIVVARLSVIRPSGSCVGSP